MIFYTKIFFSCIFFSIFFNTHHHLVGQTKPLSEIKIDEYFKITTLDKVYELFSSKYGIMMKYDREAMRTIHFNYLFTGTKADLALEVTLRKTGLKYFVDQDGIVNIVKDLKTIASGSSQKYSNTNQNLSGNQHKKKHNTALVSLQDSSLSGITINEYFMATTLDKVYEVFSAKYKMKMQYDVETMRNIAFNYTFTGTKADLALDITLRNTGMEYTVDDDGVIHIKSNFKTNTININTSQDIKTNDENPVIAATEIKSIKYNGNPEKTNFSLTGIVKDKNTGEPLPFVNIIVKSNLQGSTSNVDGYFTVFNVPSDTVAIQVSYIGYKTRLIYLNPQMVRESVVLELNPSISSLEAVEVTAIREEEVVNANEKISMLRLNPMKIATLPNIGERDIFRSFQLMPGVSAANESSAGLYVRGGTPDQSLVLYDGFTVYHVDHLFGFFSAFNNNAIKDVQLFKGGFESKYGGRLSSVVDITAKEGNRKKINFGGDASFLSVNLFAEIPIGERFSSMIAFRRSWKSALYNKIFENFSGSNQQPTRGAGGGGAGGPFQSNEKKVTSYFYDFNAKFTYNLSSKDLLSFSFYNGTDKMDNSRVFELPSGMNLGGLNFNNNIIDLTKWGNTGSSLKWSRHWSSIFYTNTLVSFSNYFSTRDRSVQGSLSNGSGTTRSFKNGTLENNDLKDYSFKMDAELKLSGKHQVEFGTQITHNDISYSYSQNDTSTIIDKRNQGTTYSFYVQDKMKFSKLQIIPGIRYNYYDLTKQHYYEPRLSATYFVSKRLSIKAAAGQYYQFAKRVIREDILQASRDFWVLADDDKLPVSSSNHFIGGFSFETDLFLFDVEGYYKTLSGLSEYSLRFNTNPGNTTYEENFYIGSGETRGIDFLIQKKKGLFSGWVSYTLGQTTNNYTVYSDQSYPASNDVRHEFKSVNMLKFKKWDFALTWIYATGKPYTSPSGAYEISLLDGTSQSYINVSSKNGLRLPDYHRLDFSATYSWKGVYGGGGSIAFSIFNLYNRSNVWYKEYDLNSGQLIESNINYLGITPNLTLSLRLR